MSRISSVIVLAMLVLTGAMGLKTVVTTHGDSSVLMANGTAPVPPVPCAAGCMERNGASSPLPLMVAKNGTAPVPPVPCVERTDAGCTERNGASSPLPPSQATAW
jgi:hypothetical protein